MADSPLSASYTAALHFPILTPLMTCMLGLPGILKNVKLERCNADVTVYLLISQTEENVSISVLFNLLLIAQKSQNHPLVTTSQICCSLLVLYHRSFNLSNLKMSG